MDAIIQELSLLVAADISASGGKLDKARKANIKIIALDDWLNSAGTAPVPEPVATSEESSTGIPKQQGFFKF